MLTRVTLDKIDRNIPLEVDISLIKYSVLECIKSMNRKHKDVHEEIKGYVRAKRHLESAIISLKNLIDPKKNSYIKQYEEEYKQLIGDLGRWNQILDKYESEIVNYRDSNISLGTTRIRITELNLGAFSEEIKLGLNTLIFKTISGATKRYNYNYFFGDKKVENDHELFGYFLFFELSNVVEVLGVISRMPGAEKKNVGQDYSLYRSLPRLPRNVRTSEEGGVEEGESELTLSPEELFSISEDDHVEPI